MEWVEQEETAPRLPPDLLVDLLREAAALPNAAPDASLRLGKALHDIGDTRGAIEILSRLTGIENDNAEAWRLRASMHLELDDYQEALAASERGGASAAILRARALIGLARNDEAERLLREMLAQDVHPAAFERLARLLARQGRGEAVLELCQARAGLPGCATIGLAYCALGLSLTRRDEEARRIVDPERHVKQVSFDPPAELGPIEQFNAGLAEQILRGQRPAVREGLGIAYEPDRRRFPNLVPLYDFFRRELERYVGELPQRGLDTVMPPAPHRVRLHSGATVLRMKGHHGDHFHPRGYVSCVYHVSVPGELSAAADLRGQLAIGTFDGLDRHCTPSWRTRHLRPQPGVLTIFPSHFFHNVVPTDIAAPRVSVAGDMEPVL